MTANLYQVRPESINGLGPEEVKLFNELLKVWSRKYARNYVRKRYYDAKNALKDLGISIPPALRKVEVVSGWPAKAVDALAVRSIFDGFTFKGKAEDDLNDLLEQNSFKLRYSQATTSELLNSCAFATVSKGADDEPQVLVSFHSALNAAAMWDYRKGRIKCGIVVTDYDESPTYGFIPNQVNMYTDDSVVMCTRHGNNRWTSERLPNEHGRPLMEPLVYRPSLDRPFGKSRISRAVMSITDSAKRTLLRTEVSSELFTSPQRYLLGADEDAFGDDGVAAAVVEVDAGVFHAQGVAVRFAVAAGEAFARGDEVHELELIFVAPFDVVPGGLDGAGHGVVADEVAQAAADQHGSRLRISQYIVAQQAPCKLHTKNIHMHLRPHELRACKLFAEDARHKSKEEVLDDRHTHTEHEEIEDLVQPFCQLRMFLFKICPYFSPAVLCSCVCFFHICHVLSPPVIFSFL